MIENLKGDIDNLYNMGVGLATSGMENLGDALHCKVVRSMTCWVAKSMKSATCMNTTVRSFEQAEHDIGSLLIDMVGGQDSVAALFNSQQLRPHIVDDRLYGQCCREPLHATVVYRNGVISGKHFYATTTHRQT